MSLSRTTARAPQTVLAVAVAAAVALASSFAAASAVAATTNKHAKPTIVLVHGAWADGSSWSAVAKELQHRGYTVPVPPNPLRGLTADTAYLKDYLKTVSGPVVLAAHSYGGALI